MPIVAAGTFPIIRYGMGHCLPLVRSWNRRPDFNPFNLALGLGLLAVALVFFALG